MTVEEDKTYSVCQKVTIFISKLNVDFELISMVLVYFICVLKCLLGSNVFSLCG